MRCQAGTSVHGVIAMYVRRINGKTITAIAAESQPDSGFFNPVFDVVGDDGCVFPRMVVTIQNMTHSSEAHALWLSEDWLLDAIAVDGDGRVCF